MAIPLQWDTVAPTVNSQAIPFPLDVDAGTMLYFLSASSNTQAITSISDGAGNTWVAVAAVTVGTSRLEVWKAPSGTGGALSPAATWGTFTNGTKRVWLVEVADQGTPTNGPTDSHDQTVAQDPMTLASITIDSYGIAFLIVFTDTTHTLIPPEGWDDAGAKYWQDMDGGNTSRAAFKIITPTFPNLTPMFNASTTETGESLIVAMYDEDQPGSPGGSPGGGDAVQLGFAHVGL